MKIKKLFLIGLILVCLVGCTNIKKLNYDEIINTLSLKEKSPNYYKNGYHFYVPKGLIVDDGGNNYSVLNSSDSTYYLYVDLVSYINRNEIEFKTDEHSVYSKNINYNKKKGYIDIKLWENNKYLIEIMYNYAKIEVMVDEHLINKALLNSINILKSVKYNDLTIEKLLDNDELSYTEENYELFDENKSNSNILKIEESNSEEQEEIKDTDFIN